MNLLKTLTVALWVSAALTGSTAALSNELPTIDGEARKVGWLFLDGIPGDYTSKYPSAPPGGIELGTGTVAEIDVDSSHQSGKSGKNGCPAILRLTLSSGRTEYESLLQAYTEGTVIPEGIHMFYERIHDPASEERSYWVRETVYEFKRLKVKAFRLSNASPENELEEEWALPDLVKNSLPNSSFHVAIQFEELNARSTPLSGTWPVTNFSIKGPSVNRPTRRDCQIIEA